MQAYFRNNLRLDLAQMKLVANEQLFNNTTAIARSNTDMTFKLLFVYPKIITICLFIVNELKLPTTTNLCNLHTIFLLLSDLSLMFRTINLPILRFLCHYGFHTFS